MDDAAIQTQFKEIFDGLPKALQNAITSADIKKRLRELADTHKLHLDQWESLESEVMMTLFGLKPMIDITKNIQSEVGVSQEIAQELAGDISAIVFAPIRKELERELEHPDAQAKEETGVEEMRTQMLSKETPVVAATSSPPVAPATPPTPPPTEKAIRMPASGAYKPGEASAERKDVHDDPYREPPA